MTRIWLGLVMMVGMVASSGLSFAETHSEYVNWGKWSFDWEVRDNTGLAIRNVTYRDELILAKASMPVVRVKYVKEQV